MPTFLSIHRLGLLLALVAALTATPVGGAVALLVLATLAGTAVHRRPRSLRRS